MAHKQKKPIKCPNCGCGGTKAIFHGTPIYLCSFELCSNVWGFWSWRFYPGQSGWFLTYEGSYWLALWHWLTTSPEEESP